MKKVLPVLLSIMFLVGLMTIIGCAQKPPTVTSVSPANAPLSGGTEITITGKGFKKTAVVSVGGVAATGVKVTPGATATIKCTVPAGTAEGPAPIVVKNDPKAKVASVPFANFSYYMEVAVASTTPDPVATPELDSAPAKIDVLFNQEVDPATVQVAVAGADGAAIAGAVTPDAVDKKMFSFAPAEPIKAGDYTVTISGAKGMVGDNNVMANHSFSIKVKEAAKKAAKKGKK